MFEYLAIWMFPALFVLVFSGFPVSFSLIGLSFAFGIGFYGNALGIHMLSKLHEVGQNYVLTALPLFIFMGCALERANIASRLFHAIQLWIGRFRGGLGLTTIGMCAVFAAASGVVGAVEIVVGMMAIPAMMKNRYKPDLMAGAVCAGGSLGTIIPPTIVVVVYGSVVEESIGDLFAGVMIPGAIMVALFMSYIWVRCLLYPDHGPPSPESDFDTPLLDKLRVTCTALLPASVLILAVLGSILMGIASPTEAAGIGAFGAFILALLYGNTSLRLAVDVIRQAIKINAMVMFTVFGGALFSSVFMANGGSDLIRAFLDATQPSSTQLIVLMLAIFFVLGFIMDWVPIILICMPVFAPLIRAAEIDPIWFGVMVCIVIQTSYLTPPVAPSIYYLRSIAPKEITYRHMFIGVTPFVLCQLLVLLVVACYPETALYLPRLIFGE